MDIKQYGSFLCSLLPELIRGRVLPAAMKRPYVWQKSDVETLFDSIFRRFPVVGFLYWQPNQLSDLTRISKGRIGPIEAGDQDRPTQLLLDGQNRLATLAWALNRNAIQDLAYSQAEREAWMANDVLVIDGTSKSIVFVPKEKAWVGLRLPAWTINSSSSECHGQAMKLIRQLQANEWVEFSEAEQDDFLAFWDHCNRAFQEARVTVTVIENASPDEARDAFLRICRVGVPMSAEDFDNSIHLLGPGAATMSDCVPYAIHKITGIDLEEVKAKASSSGFDPVQGMSPVAGWSLLRALGCSVTAMTHPGLPNSLKQAMSRLDPERSYILSTKDHWFAVVRGENHDKACTHPRTAIHHIIEVVSVPVVEAQEHQTKDERPRPVSVHELSERLAALSAQ